MPHPPNRPLMVLVFALLAWLAPTAGHATEGKLRLAVSYFENNTGSAAYAALEKGLADMLVTDLAVASELQLVEREKLSALVDEMKLGQSGLIDPATAQRMGKLLGADLVLTGSIVAIEPTMRLDARIVAVETGEVLVSAKADGASSAFFEVEAALVKQLLEGLGVKLTPIQRLKVDKPSTRSLPALARYGEALAAADRGDGKGEKAALQQALQADPTFARAQERLAALEERLAALERRTDVIERAGGLVLKPTTASDFWSNHKVHLERREVAAALTSLQGLLGVAPTSLDGLESYVTHVTATAGVPPSTDDMRRLAKGVAPALIETLAGIARKDPVAADEASRRLLDARGRDAVARYLRVVALAPPVNATPTAAERSEELMHLLALSDPEAQTALAAAFTARASLEDANARLAGRRAYYDKKPSGWGRPRSQLLLPGVTLGVSEGRTLWVRIAEPNAQSVELVLPHGVTLRPGYDRKGSLEGGTTAFAAKLDDIAKLPEGVVRVTVRYVDGKGRAVSTKLGLWMPPKVWLGSGRAQIGFGFGSGVERPASMLVDVLARVWTRPVVARSLGASFGPGWEGLPFAWGLYGIRFKSAALTRTGFARPIALRFADGARLGVIGRAEFAWLDKADARGELQSAFDTLAQEMGPVGTPWFRYADGHLETLVQLGDYVTAVDLSLDLQDIDGDPEQSFRGRFAVTNGDYRWMALLAAATRSRHRVAELARGQAFLPGGSPDTPWLRMLARAMAGEVPRAEAIAKARDLDRGKREDSSTGRFLVEAAAYLALAEPRWANDTTLRALVDEALGLAELDSLEYWILATLARERAMRDDPPQVRIGGLHYDRWETSADDYRSCVEAGACRRPSPSMCSKALGSTDDSEIRNGTGSGCWPLEPNPYPMNWLSRDHAARFCAWRKGRLPTLAEWRAAAKGATFRSLGDNLLDVVSCELTTERINPTICQERLDALGRENLFDGYLGLAPQGAHPAGRVASGLEGLLGNVAEWVSDGENRAAGCHYNDAPGAVSGEPCAQRVTTVPTLASGLVGFRCVYDGEAPSLPPAAQAEREKKKARLGKPEVKWVKVPAGELERGVSPEPVSVAIASPDKAELAAVAKAVDGLASADLARFLAALEKLGIEGRLDSHRLGELVLRGRYREMDAKATFDAVLSLIEPQAGEEAQRLANERAKELLAVSVYHDGAYQSFASRMKLDKAALSKAQQRQALFDYLTRYDGNRDANLRDEMAPLPRWPGRRSYWDDHLGPGCLDQKPGACRDLTGIRGASIVDEFVRRERVTVAAFEIMAREVTQAQYLALTGMDPSYERCPECPVTQVSWEDAERFCKAIGGRLPGPDEWERAARGTAARGVDGELGEVAWYVESSGRRPHEVATRKPNGLGLYDMLGNVWEWTGSDPGRGNDDRKKYIRGGSWGVDARLVRPERRIAIEPRVTSDFIGFRCAR